jgi:hypothetical protein
MKILASITSCILSIAAFHQSIMAQAPVSQLESWSAQSPIEKAYLHTDRENYLAGEIIWFKAYLLSEFLPDTISTTLYTELVDANAVPIVKKAHPIQFATARGQFEIPDSLPSGYFTIRAFTSTMLNHDANYIFQKRIFIYGKNGMPKAVTTAQEIKMNFFPEAGQLVQGEVNRIAYKITNQYTDPVNASGVIVGEAGDTLTSFTSYHDGMGYFNLLPVPGKKYFAVISNNRFGLPAAAPTGVLFKVNTKEEELKYEVFQPSDNLFKAAYLVGQMQHKVALQQPLKDITGSLSGIIPTKELPSGVMQLTLFNKDHQPLAERLVFIDNKEYKLAATVSTDTLNFSDRGQNEFAIQLSELVNGSFSLAVTDADMELTSYRESHILSSFLLAADIDGYVYNAAWYFNTTADSARNALDVLMMVNGWRRFKWTEIATKAKQPKQFTDAGFISIAGKASIRDTKRPVGDKQLMFMQKSLQDSLQASSMQMAATNDRGEFRLDSLIFYGKTAFMTSDVSEKQKKWLDITTSTDSVGFKGAMPRFNTQILKSKRFAGSNGLEPKLGTDLAALLAGEGKILEEVAIKVKKKSAEQILDEKYSSGMFSSGTGTVIDLINSGEKINQANILDYLQGRVPGVLVTRYNTTDYFVNYRNARSLMGGPIPMTIFLNEMQVDTRILATIPANEVAMIKVLPFSAGAEGNGRGGVLAVYTKKGSDRLTNFDSNVSFFTYHGYSITKEFYSEEKRINPETPKGMDTRITLHWQPLIFITGDTKTIPVRFFNTDRTKRYKLVAEGVTTDGRILQIEKVVENSKKGF